MSLNIRTNIGSVNAQRNLADATGRLATSYERLSSGLRINRASDDAAGCLFMKIGDLVSTEAHEFHGDHKKIICKCSH